MHSRGTSVQRTKPASCLSAISDHNTYKYRCNTALLHFNACTLDLLQVVPLPGEMKSEDLRQAFIDSGKAHKLEFAEIERGSDLGKVVEGTLYICYIPYRLFPLGLHILW